ncbi:MULTISPECIES: 4'-phosphopantetheinyl transferase family protein [unclassified Streptomyces]|uniref:4'-phosphopantetheinyl transferase family protein n=1 Tax=unclassified Streptomyces TaxID=2593676 RepID=UPI003791FC21
MPHAGQRLHLSITHSGGLGMLAVSRFQVGVDVEAVRGVRVLELMDKVLTPAEREVVLPAPEPQRTDSFLRCWTRKEAVLKAVGVGITTALCELETYPAAPGPVELTTDALGAPSAWVVSDVAVPPGWHASVALPHGSSRNIGVHPR